MVASLDAATGKEQWKFAYHTRYRDDFGFDEGPRATPLIAEGRVFTLGANGYIKKPFTLDQITAVLQRILGLPPTAQAR